MKLPRMLLAAVVFLTAAGFPTFAGSHQQQSDQDAGEQASHQQARPQHAGPQNGQQVAPPDSSTQDSSASSDQALPPKRRINPVSERRFRKAPDCSSVCRML